MTRRYAEGTSVPAERSEAEIKKVLRAYGAESIGVMDRPEQVTVYFDCKGRAVQVTIPMPKRAPDSASRQLRSTRDADAEHRRRWRVLVLWIKGMFEAIQGGILTFDEAFLAHLVIPGTAETIGARMVPRLPALYEGTAIAAALMQDNPR